MAEEIKKDEAVADEKLSSVSGGFSLEENPCPRCHSSNVYVYLEHDEIEVMRCNACGHQWSVMWG